jgi:hypothetical protein
MVVPWFLQNFLGVDGWGLDGWFLDINDRSFHFVWVVFLVGAGEVFCLLSAI